VPFDMPIHDAWLLLRQNQIKALPVIDRHRQLVGIVTQSDLLRALYHAVHCQMKTSDPRRNQD